MGKIPIKEVVKNSNGFGDKPSLKRQQVFQALQ
jgi:hypothetical protein